MFYIIGFIVILWILFVIFSSAAASFSIRYAIAQKRVTFSGLLAATCVVVPTLLLLLSL